MTQKKTTSAPLKPTKKFDDGDYVLTKLDYSEADLKTDVAFYKAQGREVKTGQEGIFWLLYTKVGK